MTASEATTVRRVLFALSRIDLDTPVWIDPGNGMSAPLARIVDETGGTAPRVLLVSEARNVTLTPAVGMDDGEEEW